MNATAPAADRLLSLAEVERLTGLRSSALYLRVQRNEFPAPLRISSRCSRWRESEVIAWIESLPRGTGARFGAAVGSAA